MILKATRFLFVLICATIPSLTLSQSQNVPLDHWAYAFLDRLQTRGLYVSEDFDTRPYSREAMAEIIVQISEKVKKDSTLLSPVEWQRFEQLKGDFYEELRAHNPGVTVRQNEYEPHLFTYRNEDIDVRADGLLGHQRKFFTGDAIDHSIPKSLSYVGLSLRVDIKKSMAIYAEERSFFLSDTDSLKADVFNPSVGIPITGRSAFGGAVTDNATAYAVFRLPWFDLEVGRDLVEWGPGARGNLILSRNSNVYDLFKLDFRFKKFKFESFHAFLNSDESKYLVGRRIEVRPFDTLQLAISETAVYGNRSVEFLYINPFVPITVAERHLGNKDNNMISFDGTVFIKNRVKLYTEILLDDFSFAENLFHNFVNKWGVMLGANWIDPFGLENTDFRFELTRIQPFVYTHREPINTYSNYDNVMGHWLGPDADDWYFEISHQFHKNLRLGSAWEQRRRGNNDIHQGTEPEDAQIHFLDGVVERNRFLSLLAQWQVWRDIYLNFNYSFVQSRNMDRVAGNNQNSHRLIVQFALNY